MSRAEIVSTLARQPTFRRLALSHSACPSDAEEALQTAYLIALEHLPQNIDTEEAGVWLNLVLRRECWRRYRQRRHRGERELLDVHPAGAGADPDHHMEAMELLGQIAALPSGQRTAMVARIAGLSYAETRAQAGATHTAVNRWTAKGRRRLRELRAAA